MVAPSLEAAEILEIEGVTVDVIDARWLNPFDTLAVCESVTRTGRLAVVHEATLTGAFSSQVVAGVVEAGVPLVAPPVRIGSPDTRIPAAPSLLGAVVPNVSTIVEALRRMVTRED
jgi:pyruvate/2-oxoglutarate/acetoin dehydrogenase E1 component